MSKARWGLGAKQFNAAAFEWYIEPAWADDLLFRKETFGPVIWDPSCGSGTIPETAKKHGYRTIASDIVDREYAGLDMILDFTDAAAVAAVACAGVADIVANPPYYNAKTAVRFIDIALGLTAGRVAVLVNDSFLYSGGHWNKKTRRFTAARHDKFIGQWPLSKIYFFSSRPSMPPGGLDVTPKGGQINYIWLVFDLGYDGPAATDWLRLGGGQSR